MEVCLTHRNWYRKGRTNLINVDLAELKSQIGVEIERVERRQIRLLEQLEHVNVVRDLAAASRVQELNHLPDYGRFVLQSPLGTK